MTAQLCFFFYSNTQDELKQQTKTRIKHEHEIRVVLLPRIEQLETEFSNFRKEAAALEAKLRVRIRQLEQDLADMTAKYKFEKREKELYEQRAADFEYQTKVLQEKNPMTKTKTSTRS